MKYFTLTKSIVFSLMFIISLIFIFYTYIKYKNIISESFYSQVNINYNVIKTKFENIENEYINILDTIANHSYTKDYLLNLKKEKIEQLFEDFAKTNKYIFQIRLLDTTGMELIRLNSKNNKFNFIDKNDLQNKFSRYYFQNFIKLNHNEFAISYLDLNIENSRIETPHVGTLRIGTPIYINNNKQALLIININMNNYLKDILNSSYYDISLIDNNGYFIYHPNNNLSWSKYKENKITVKNKFNIDLNSNKSSPDKKIILKPLNILNNSYYLLFKIKNESSINKLLSNSQYLTVLLFLSFILICIPFIYLIFEALVRIKRNNITLLENKNKIESILDNTSDAIILINKYGIIKEINRSALNMFKYSKEELINENINILIPSPHHDKHDMYLKNYDKTFKSKIINQNRELHAINKDKDLINISLTVTQLKIDTELYFLGTIQNLSDELKNKRLFENVFNFTPIGIALVSKDGTFLKLNEKFCSIVNYSEEELLKLTFQDITHNEDLEKDLNLLSKVINKEIDSYTMEKRYITKENIIIWVKLTVTAVYEDIEKNIFNYFIATIENISSLKKLEKEKKQKEMLLLQQSKLASMGEMIGAIAHQWRQPLNSIGFIVQDMISAYKHDEFDEKYLYEIKKEMMEQLKYMSDTIDQFRNFFKKDEDKKVFNLINTLLNVEQLYRAQLHAHKLKLVISIDNNDISVLSDVEKDKYKLLMQEGQLKQVLINLISNAKDAIIDNKDKEIEKTIYVELNYLNTEISISVKDFAGGVKQENINRIFEPYFTTKELGTGLGLFIAKTICEKNLKSDLNYERLEKRVKNKIIKGSSFIISIPK